MTINASRVQPGVPTGGQFATSPRTEADVQLSAPADAAVRVSGVAGPAAGVWAEAISSVPGVREADLEVDRDDGTHFAATARIHGVEYRVSKYDANTYRVAAVDGSGYGDAVAPLDTLRETFGESLRKTRTAQLAGETLKSVESVVREEYSGEQVSCYPVAMHRDGPGATEIGFALPGDHIKVRVYDQTPVDGEAPEEGELFSYSAITDGYNALTARQRRNRLNKALDAISPDRELGETFMRRYLALASVEHDRRVTTDPLLTPRP